MYRFKRKPEHFGYFVFFLILLLTSLLVCLFALRYVAHMQTTASKNDFNSINLAYEVSRTSDNATKMLRMYVMSGEKKYLGFYNEILAIRNGTAPRPIKFSQLYWDLVLEPDKRPKVEFGPPESLRDMMFKRDFAIEELAILNNAQGKIHELLHMEKKALNAMHGLYEDSNGNFTVKGKPDPELAEKILFGDEYLKVKADVLMPVNEFYQRVINRTQKNEVAFDSEIKDIVSVAIILAILTTALMLLSLYKVLNSLSKANKEYESLLTNIFPKTIANRLKKGEVDIADEFSQASILFADLINFTELAKNLGPKKIVHLLNELFEVFDEMTDEYNVEKVKTIGDNYMVAGGIPIQTIEHATNLANFALAMLEKLKEFNQEHNLTLQIRIGMATGPLIAGVIGNKKFVYDVWGNVVNLASRLEQLSQPNAILISERMAMLLEEQYTLEEQETIEVRGMGLRKTFFLLNKKV